MGKKRQLGYSAQQIADGARARDKASQSTPRAVVDAFFPDRVLAGDLPLQPVTMSVIIALQKVGSGLLKTETVEELAMEDIAKALYIFTSPIAAVRQQISCGTFADAVDDLADQIPANLLPPIGKLLNAHLTEAFATAIPHGPKDRSDASSPFPPARTPEPGTVGSPP